MHTNDIQQNAVFFYLFTVISLDGSWHFVRDVYVSTQQHNTRWEIFCVKYEHTPHNQQKSKRNNTKNVWNQPQDSYEQ